MSISNKKLNNQEGNKMKKCFTINCMRTKEDFDSYNELLDQGLFAGVELFYPYNVSPDQQKLYQEKVDKLIKKHSYLDVVLHLPHGGTNDLLNPDGSRNEEIITRMKDAMLFAKEFHTKRLTLHLGNAFKDLNSDRRMLVYNLTKPLQELCDFAGQYKMNVMIVVDMTIKMIQNLKRIKLIF